MRLRPKAPEIGVEYESRRVHVPHGEAPDPHEVGALTSAGWELRHISRPGWAAGDFGVDLWFERPIARYSAAGRCRDGPRAGETPP
jgi:hypothetical protein